MRCNVMKATKAQLNSAQKYCMKWLQDEAMPTVTKNVEAIILWQLHVECGWGKKRLMRFLEKTTPLITGILKEYNWNTDSDAIWYCTYKLKSELGIDLDKICSPFRDTEVDVK